MKKNILSIFIIFLLSSTITLPYVYGQYKIGFSQCSTNHDWRKFQIRQMQIETALYPDLELIIKDAQNNTNKQIDQIKEFLDEGIDLLIVSAEDSKALTPIIEDVFKQGKHVILLERKINSESFTSFIGCDNYSIGKEAAQYASNLLRGKGQIIEITGMAESWPAIERHRGFKDELAKYPHIIVKESINGEWLYGNAYTQISKFIKSGGSVDLIFSHNDIMALGALQAFKSLDIKNRPYLLGVDGLMGQQGGIDAVLNKDVDATFLYPTGGDLAIQVANNILKGKPFKRYNILETIVIDSTNSKILNLLTNQNESFQRSLESQSSDLNLQISKKQSQTLVLILITACISLIIIQIFLVYRNFKNKVKVNLSLVEINNEIENQNTEIVNRNNELIRFGNELEQTLNVKLSFFTIVSHEFKTPLTLIKGPLENLMEKKIFRGEEERFLFNLIYKNTLILMQLISQLMDFRKLERNKLELNPSKINAVNFLNDIIRVFSSLADKKKVLISFDSRSDDIEVYLDFDKMHKSITSILFYLLNHPSISDKVVVKISELFDPTEWSKGKEILIEISDSNIVLTPEELKQIFNVFEESTKFDNSLKTIFGLNLAKQFIEMHGGKILVKSNEMIGVSFNIYLPILDESSLLLLDELETNLSLESSSSLQIEHQILDFQEQKSKKLVFNEVVNSNLPLILIVEDNEDIRKYVKMSLIDKYLVHEAKNGFEALCLVQKQEPDLIVSDVVMPVMGGMELVRQLKSDIKTCHIPIILLTAWGEMEHTIEGLEVGADAYLQKPFNSKHLQIRISKLLELRYKLFEYYKSEQSYYLNTKDYGLNIMDKNFLNDITKLIETSIGNNDFTVDKLSENMNMSRGFLYRKIKKITNMSISEFIISLKLKSSLESLRNSGKTISEISYKAGFSTPSYYTRCFKSFYNITPSEYVERNKTYR